MAFKKGHKYNLGNKYALGYKHTEEWKKAASERMKGNTRGFTKGKPSPRKGKKARFPAWNKGIKLPHKSGENHWNWKGDRSKIARKHRMRGTMEWREWRRKVFERDSFTCQECNKNFVYLEPHHIISLEEDITKAYEVSNGITLCRLCHMKTIRKEKEFQEKYSQIVKMKVERKIRRDFSPQ